MNAGDQTLYLVFRMAELGMEGGLSALKITGKGAAGIASTLAHLGQSASKILFRERRVKSLLKHGDIATTVLTIKEKDKDIVESLLKRNKITGFIVKPPSRLIRESETTEQNPKEKERTINIFIRSTDANKATAILGELAALAGQLETSSNVPDIAQASDIRTWEPDHTAPVSTVEILGEGDAAKPGHVSIEEPSPDWGAALDTVTRKNENISEQSYESKDLSVSVREGEVAEDPFAKASNGIVKSAPNPLTTDGLSDQNSANDVERTVHFENGRTVQALSPESTQLSNISKIEKHEKNPTQMGVMDVMNKIKDDRKKDAPLRPSPSKIKER